MYGALNRNSFVCYLDTLRCRSFLFVVCWYVVTAYSSGKVPSIVYVYYLLYGKRITLRASHTCITYLVRTVHIRRVVLLCLLITILYNVFEGKVYLHNQYTVTYKATAFLLYVYCVSGTTINPVLRTIFINLHLPVLTNIYCR